MTWNNLEQADAELASFGVARLSGGVAYLATVRKDGSPRVHPVTPIIGQGRMFVFMEPTSPKGFDLRRDGRYALHSAVGDNEGSNGEFIVSGRAILVTDATTRALATELARYRPQERYILFELSAERAQSTVYPDHGAPVRRSWPHAEAKT